ncbi:STM4015 family protein [Streptomyces hainanensis]|uniref:Leucine-rich repeat domain-containing protein n=1 Tax=Streptomyces hainanensis TaxID=402648 RepID=A0A4V2Y2H3_9ACTN|nr:STM4015 family protein [Streptomyces hainanensis]TDC72635.1 leucine-rich repeat domain-containing protein [Streptomyces hainanensis]
MSIGNHLEEFHGLPAFDFPDSVRGPEDAAQLPAPESVAWRVMVECYASEEEWEEAFARFLAAVDTTRVRALIVGAWNDLWDIGPSDVLAALVAARDRLPALRGLFFGDIVREESDIAYIPQGTVTPLLNTFPELEEFAVRGGSDLEFPAVRHARLRRLTIETGGMPATVVRGVAASDLPALEHLDLWLGTSEYGGDTEMADLAPILAGTRLPALRHLALRNSEIQDEICAGLASAPVVARLDVLDVSMGVLTDDGATALLTGQPLTHLQVLDMHHNYLSEAMCGRLRESLEPAGVRLDLDLDDVDPNNAARFVAVGE